MVPNAAIDKFHSMLMDDDEFNEAMMRVALKVAHYYQPGGEPYDEETMALAMELVTRVSVA